MRGTRKWLMVAVVAMVAALAVYGCGGDDDDTSAETTGGGADLGLIQDGQLLAGIDTPYPPFEKGHPPNVTGYDIDVINAIAAELGLEVSPGGDIISDDLP